MSEDLVKYLKTYQANEVLIREGNDQNDFFCLIEGRVGIWKGSPENREKQVKIGELVEKGTYFGEISCLIKEPRTASIVAEDGPVKVLKMPGEMLPQMMLKQPSLGLKLCTALADRLRGTTTRHQEAALQRNEIRDDATAQFLHARESFQKIFVMLTAIQAQLQHPSVKALIEYMARDKMMQGGRKLQVDDSLIEGIPRELQEPVRQAFSNILN